jgi:hypothetical protein
MGGYRKPVSPRVRDTPRLSVVLFSQSAKSGRPRNGHPEMLSLMFSRLPRLAVGRAVGASVERARGSAES